MGMTNEQFASFRREQLEKFERMLSIAISTNADSELIKDLQKEVEKAKKDTEK
jgi:hypothetical protein